MKKIIGKFAVAIFALSAFWGSQANAALIGIGASAPDMQFLSSTVTYVYDSGASTGVLTIANSFASQWKDESGTNYTRNPFDTDGANPTNFNVSLLLTATIDSLGQIVSSGVNTIVMNGIMNFTPYNISVVTDLLTASVDQVGFDSGAGALDFVGTVSGGHPDIANLFGQVGVIASSTNFSSWTQDFSSFISPVDVTTPVTAVPVPAGFPLMVLGFALLLRKTRFVKTS